MKFDYTISNPAFNIAVADNIAGTGGYTTLYRTATINDFQNRLKDGGTLVNITLKGITQVLFDGKLKDYQTTRVDLMDNIKVWPYNTCFFLLKKEKKKSETSITGGMAAKIFTLNKDEQFDMVYYSGSNNGPAMVSKFNNGKNKVIRRLPGRNNDSPIYDYTDEIVDSSPKFAFSVMESRKSHLVTSEPIYGGTICYIRTSSIEEAEKLKLFVNNNKVFSEYVKRMNQEKNSTFSLRNVKKFDLNQIVTGEEIPIEWGLQDEDLLPPTELVNDIVEDRTAVKESGEVFTPTPLVDLVLDALHEQDPNAFTDKDKTFIDSMCGNGQFLKRIYERKIANGHDPYQALETIFGIELTLENVLECHERLAFDDRSADIVRRNIVCADSLKYDSSFGTKENVESDVKNVLDCRSQLFEF
jgi:hypothetical protein